MLLVGRSWSPGSEYRYGFNGKESDPETYGDGNIYDYGFRIYNPRLGMFLSVDPLTSDYPMLTPYQFASNTPIWAIDLDGLEAWKSTRNASDVLSIEGWNDFAVAELKVMEEKAIKMDCADTWLYLIAKYHKVNGVEFSYYNPTTEKTISSDDSVWGNGDEVASENFIWGMEESGKFNGGSHNQTAQDGFLAAYGNAQLLIGGKEGGFHSIAKQIGAGTDLQPLDALSSGSHMSISLNGLDIPPTDPGETKTGNQILYATGSGYYYGGGLGNSNTGVPFVQKVEFRYGYNNLDLIRILRPSFLEPLPENQNQPEPIELIKSQPLK